MKQDNTGGPAFPILKTDTHDTWSGMTLRDWFAGQALAGIMANSEFKHCTTDEMVMTAKHLADAMIAARNGGQDT